MTVKAVILGLDGGTFRVIDHLTALGRLPSFARALEEGTRATLMSTVPPITPAAWASFYTGTNPGKSGIVDFFKWRAGTYSLAPVNTTTVRGRTLWSLASRHGRRVCVYNVPVTWPATPVNGIMISGMDAPCLDEAAVYPSEFRKELLLAVPDFAIEAGIDYRYLVNNFDDPVAEYIRLQNQHFDMEIRTVRYLQQLEDWDLFVAVFRTPDAFQHIFWDSVERALKGEETLGYADRRRAEAVFTCYERLDLEIAESWSAANRNLIIMSDHGFGLLQREVCLNRVLAEAGLLKFHSRGVRQRTKRYFIRKAQKRISPRDRQRIKKILGRDDVGRKWDIFVDALVADIDWNGTRLCSVGQFGCLFVNLKGREPLGVVDGEEERQAVLREAELALRGFIDPLDGKHVVSAIHRKEELFRGAMLAELPDLVVVMRDYAYRGIYSTEFELSGKSLVREPRQERKELVHSGTHRREGILILCGPGIGVSNLGEAEMVDIAPTVANLLELTPLADWDGHVLEGALAGGTASYMGQKGIPGALWEPREGHDDHEYSEDEEAKVRKRLEDLGYL